MFAKRLSAPAMRHALNVPSLRGMTADPTAACNPLSWCRRYCSSVSVHAGSSARPASVSAVNVEQFTLNEEVVKQDLANMAKWNALSEAIGTARAAGDHTKLLGHVQAGLQMLQEMGATNAPIQCESLLCMEASQAHYKMRQYDEALRCAEQARESLLRGCKPELQDRAQIAEIEVFMGFILCKQGDYGAAVEAQELLQKVLRWVDVDAKSAMPMQAVAAVNLRRSVLTGLGLSTTVQATALASKGETSEAKELYAKGLDMLIEALNLHIDENDFELVKMTLKEILTSFEGLGDVSQAVTTCRKYISWCSRHDDASGVADGEAMLTALCARHAIENLLDAAKA
ncbi:hypothetical protein JIQ42_05378 [Leishmania sp. Namibia]|uniref:hypothetical protein n=1 Tax=Leishmania sp. Namibia TaxID=2802991 RepID=UPI001B69E794|nr:hypothetical protein JIQ42_05378 [Leishmania sp. Namibia]